MYTNSDDEDDSDPDTDYDGDNDEHQSTGVYSDEDSDEDTDSDSDDDEHQFTGVYTCDADEYDSDGDISDSDDEHDSDDDTEATGHNNRVSDDPIGFTLDDDDTEMPSEPQTKYTEEKETDTNNIDNAIDLANAIVEIGTAELAVILQQVKHNKLGFTDRQVEQAYRARELYHMCGAPIVEKFKLLIKTGFVHNCPVTAKDVTNAETIFGPDIPTLKGRTVRKTPPVARDTVVDIPPELLHLSLIHIPSPRDATLSRMPSSA